MPYQQAPQALHYCLGWKMGGSVQLEVYILPNQASEIVSPGFMPAHE